MRYEVRFQVNGEETTHIVDAETAASAAQLAQETYAGTDQAFELIQVHLLDETHSVLIEDQTASSV